LIFSILSITEVVLLKDPESSSGGKNQVERKIVLTEFAIRLLFVFAFKMLVIKIPNCKFGRTGDFSLRSK